MKQSFCVSTHPFLLGLIFLFPACDGRKAASDEASNATASGAATNAPATSAAVSAGSASAAGAPSAQAPSAPEGTAVLGGPDWKAVFVGAPPMELPPILGGGQGRDNDHTRETGHAGKIWKYAMLTGGGVYWAPSKKALAIHTNPNLDTTAKTLDLWMKSGSVKDVKHSAGPEVNEIGPNKVLALTGAGTCALKGGEAADFYWYDLYSPGDDGHSLDVVIVAKDAPEDEKQVALTLLRQVKLTPRAKPYYKKG